MWERAKKLHLNYSRQLHSRTGGEGDCRLSIVDRRRFKILAILCTVLRTQYERLPGITYKVKLRIFNVKYINSIH